MKTQLDLMQIACSHETQSECKQVQMDTTDIVNDILALSLTAVNLDIAKGRMVQLHLLYIDVVELIYCTVSPFKIVFRF